MTCSRSSRWVLAVGVLGAVAGTCPAWGPHTEITAAGLAVLPDREKVRAYLGDDFGRLSRDYCWMGDWQEAVRPDHYADDYLLFPASPRHVSHMHPHVRKTFAPFFRRALQAIRSESPREAARWVGSLLHFVQDAGSPPHTTGIGGPLHGKMERWVDESKIAIDGYEPKSLGPTDEAALRGFEERMAALHDFAKSRAEKLRPLVEELGERANQPLELECALEVARVTADTVHTLFAPGLRQPAVAGATLEGSLRYTSPAGYATVPAKVALEGTDFSTTTIADGRYVFRNLPPGRYTAWILATGFEAERVTDVALVDGKATDVSPRLRPDPVAGNLVRNPRFKVRWVTPDQPDCWGRDSVKSGRWASAPIRVPVGTACSVRVEFVPGKRVPVSVRWRSNPSSTADSREVALAGPDFPVTVTTPALTPFEKGYLFLEVLLHTDGPPADVCRHVAVTYRPK
ncbi:MAG TPA: carboxypeptidase regulatory-like domain-containing protein [Gemmataceae bacterium]|nr:carboxypeptidase regulatory-like domain-containing protein [Gemmataceae bacterium]